MPSTWVTTSNGCPLILVDIGQQTIIEAWRNHYNAVRPHMSLNYLTPVEFSKQHQNPPINPNRAIPQ